jgi:putative mRNA 3-end processing factor
VAMSFYSSPLISLTEKGLYCEAGDFYIDPKRVVSNAVVTHAHSDHARRGSAQYITVDCGVGVLKERLGRSIQVRGVPYGQAFTLGKARVSFHSAGHILGSCQVRVEHDDEVWVASGDYKRDHDPSCDPFEKVECDTFITEATFGTPKFTWEKNQPHGRDISNWWKEMARANKNAVLFGYSLGKAQRILAELAPYAEKPVLIHSSVVGITERYREEGRVLAPTEELSKAIERSRGVLCGELIIAPPSVFEEKFASRLFHLTRGDVTTEAL